MGGENCPICKSMIYTIRQDLEFDKINNQSNSDIDLIFPSLNINFLNTTRLELLYKIISLLKH
jgi:hypothetical protein